MTMPLKDALERAEDAVNNIRHMGKSPLDVIALRIAALEDAEALELLAGEVRRLTAQLVGAHTHEVKSHPAAFEARRRGVKPWEFRKNDRGYKVGDHLHEREWDPGAVEGQGAYTGEHILSRVVFIREGGVFGIPDGYCIMTVETIACGRWLPREEARP